MATAAQINELAAENLGVLGEGQTLRSEHSSDLTQAYTEVYAILQGLNLTTWSSTAAVPDEYAGAIAMLVAGHRAVKYRPDPANYQRIKLEGWGLNMDGEAIKVLRKLQSPAQMGQTEIENF